MDHRGSFYLKYLLETLKDNCCKLWETEAERHENFPACCVYCGYGKKTTVIVLLIFSSKMFCQIMFDYNVRVTNALWHKQPCFQTNENKNAYVWSRIFLRLKDFLLYTSPVSLAWISIMINSILSHFTVYCNCILWELVSTMGKNGRIGNISHLNIR